jgi:MoxR-like ATPase
MLPFQIIRSSDVAGEPPAEPVRLEPDDRRGDPASPPGPFGPYLLSPDLATTINVALALDQPLLVTGEPGCGKTALAWAIAAQLGTTVLPFHTKSTSMARDLLYQVDTLRRFHDATTGDPAARDASRYVTYRALGEAIRSDRTHVVLIDEIDKASRDLPNDLLNELDRMELVVTEVDPPASYRARARHFVLITSNNERRLPSPFLRRCVYAHLEFPDAEVLAKIVALHCDRPSQGFVGLCVRRFLELRSIGGLVKPPATGELIAWVRVLGRMAVEPAVLEAAASGALPALEVLLKTIDDLRLVRNGRGVRGGGGRGG